MTAGRVAEVLANHGDCLTNCDVKWLGIWDQQAHYAVVFTCGIEVPLPTGLYPRDMNPQHLAAALVAAGLVVEGVERVEWGVRAPSGRVIVSMGTPWTSLDDIRAAFGAEGEITAPLVTRTTVTYPDHATPWVPVDAPASTEGGAADG